MLASGCRRSATSARRPTSRSSPARTLPDPKDKREILERYRAAVDFASQRQWPQAIALLQQILHDDPEMADVWSQLAVFATRLDRFDLAVDAYKHYIALKPQEPTAYIGAAAALLKLRKLDEAREYAQPLGGGGGRGRPSIPGIGARDAGQDRAGQARHRHRPRRGRAGAHARIRRCRCRSTSTRACSTTRGSTPRRCPASCRPAPS